MKKETKDILLVVAVGFAVMLALPAAYRVWVHYNPPPPRRPLSALLHNAGAARREALLETPADKWTEPDRALAPDVADWLAAHSSVVLPWEMSGEARKKDWKGYCGSWRRIVEEQVAELDELSRENADAMEEAADRARMERRNMANAMSAATNLLAGSGRPGAPVTNAYPVVVTVRESTPGRFFGWSERSEDVKLGDEAALREFAEGRRRAAGEWASLAEAHERERDAAGNAVAELARAKEGLVAALAEIAESERGGYSPGWPAAGCTRRLLGSIATAYRHRPPKSDRLPKWLPGRVRRWLGGNAEEGPGR